MIDWNAIRALWEPANQRGEYWGLEDVVASVKRGGADEQSIAVLCSMLGSDYEDVKCDAAGALEGVAEQAQTWLGSWLQSGNADAARFAARALFEWRWIAAVTLDRALLRQALPFLDHSDREKLRDSLRGP